MTIHEPVEALDAGPIAAQRAFPIGAGGRRRRRLRARGRARGRAARASARRRAAFAPQPEEGVTYAEKITAADRELDLSRPEEPCDRVRALSPHIGARARAARRPRHWSGARASTDGGSCRVEVQPEGKRRMATTSSSAAPSVACESRSRDAPRGRRVSRSSARVFERRAPTTRSRVFEDDATRTALAGASTRAATARSRSRSRTARCSACARSTTGSRSSAGGPCASSTRRCARRCASAPTSSRTSTARRHAAANESVELVARGAARARRPVHERRRCAGSRRAALVAPCSRRCPRGR